MGNLLCIGLLILQFRAIPTPRRLDDADDRLRPGMDVDVLNRNLLLTLAAMSVERFKQRGNVRESLFACAMFSCRPSKVCSPIIARR